MSTITIKPLKSKYADTIHDIKEETRLATYPIIFALSVVKSYNKPSF